MKSLIIVAVLVSLACAQTKKPDVTVGVRAVGDELLTILYEQTPITATRENITLHYRYDGTGRIINTTCLEIDSSNNSFDNVHEYTLFSGPPLKIIDLTTRHHYATHGSGTMRIYGFK